MSTERSVLTDYQLQAIEHIKAGHMVVFRAKFTGVDIGRQIEPVEGAEGCIFQCVSDMGMTFLPERRP